MKEKKISQVTVSGIVGIVLCILFIPIIIINLILIIGSYTSPEEIPGVLGFRPVIVLSGSMEPAIQTGDMILLHKADSSQLKEGDVICYLVSGKAITHRIVEITTGEDGQTRYITQGDDNNTADQQAVTADQIQGIWKGDPYRRPGGFCHVHAEHYRHDTFYHLSLIAFYSLGYMAQMASGQSGGGADCRTGG